MLGKTVLDGSGVTGALHSPAALRGATTKKMRGPVLHGIRIPFTTTIAGQLIDTEDLAIGQVGDASSNGERVAERRGAESKGGDSRQLIRPALRIEVWGGKQELVEALWRSASFDLYLRETSAASQ